MSKIKKSKSEIKELPEIYDKISARFAVDYRLAVRIWMDTLVKIDMSKPFGIGLIFSIPKKEKEFLLQKIISEIISNDKILKKLLKMADYESFWLKDDIEKLK